MRRCAASPLPCVMWCSARAILLPGTAVKSSQSFYPILISKGQGVIAERVRGAVEAERIPHGVSDVSPYVTISAGVAIRVARGQRVEAELLEQSDQVMYRAKQNGRNRVEVVTGS